MRSSWCSGAISEHLRFGRGKVPIPTSPNIKDIVYFVAELIAALCLLTGTRKWKYFISSSGNRTHHLTVPVDLIWPQSTKIYVILIQNSFAKGWTNYKNVSCFFYFNKFMDDLRIFFYTYILIRRSWLYIFFVVV